MAAIEQRQKDGQEHQEQHQQWRHQQQGHLHLVIHHLVKARAERGNARQTWEIIGFHCREHHTGIGHRHHIARIV